MLCLLLERLWNKSGGGISFLFFYFSTGIGAGLVYTLVNYLEFQSIYSELLKSNMSADAIESLLQTGKYNPFDMQVSAENIAKFYSLYHSPAVGASGAIYGILVAFGMLFPEI